jgi:hypothetical protein
MSTNAPVILSSDASSSTDPVVRQSEWFIANATIAAGDWVITDVSSTRTALGRSVCPSASAAQIARGVAMNAAVAGDQVQVCKQGEVRAKVAGGTAAGDRLQTTATAATAGVASAADERMCGLALAAESGGFARCLVTCPA